MPLNGVDRFGAVYIKLILATWLESVYSTPRYRLLMAQYWGLSTVMTY
jgi:hypothetical protein